MAFVRKVRTKSGATAVQIARYVGGRQEIVKHLGSAHTDVELGMLLERARAWLEPDQQTLDLGVTPQLPVEKPLASGQSALLEPAAGPAQVDVPGRTESTGSVLLRQVLTEVYDQLDFGTVGDPVFRDLVIARIVEPGSKLDAGRVLQDLGADPPSYATIKRHLKQVIERDYRDRIAEKCFAHTAKKRKMTCGKSGTRRRVGSIRRSWWGCWWTAPVSRSRSDATKATRPKPAPSRKIVRQFQLRHDLDGVEMVVAADAGMLSAANLMALDRARLKFIVGSRVTKAPGDLASYFHWNGTLSKTSRSSFAFTPRHGRSVVNNSRKRSEPVWDQTEYPTAWRAAWQYSRSRAARDEKTLNAQEARARAVVDGDTTPKSRRSVTVTAKGRRLDTASLERARMLVGLKGYVTNLPASLMDPAEIIGKYHELWHVEQSFRMSRTDLRARPIFHRTRDAIKAHLTVVFAALAVSRVVQDRSGLAIGKVVKLLRPLRSATIANQRNPAHVPTRSRRRHAGSARPAFRS